MSKNNLVSVITPTYNSSSFIEETIKSVQNQTHQNWEMLITDDCSTDETLKIVQRLADEDPRIKVYKLQQNSGPAVARNNSIEKAEGRYLAFLDSDDLWLHEKLAIQIQEMVKKNAPVCHTNYLHVDEEGNNLGKRIIAIKSLDYKKQLKNNYIGNLTGIYDIQALGKIYSPLIKKRQDWAVWLEAIKRSGKGSLGINKDLAKYRIRKDSISSNKIELLKHNFIFYNQHLKFNLVKSSIRMVIFLFEYFLIRPRYFEKFNPKQHKS